jgi:benzodiazapine receptor
MPRKKIANFVAAFTLCLLAGYAGAYFAAPSLLTWFTDLQKPDTIPQMWVFETIWIPFSILSAISLYLILRSGLETKGVKFGLALFLFMLLMNIIWLYSFFALHSTFFGLMAVLLLWIVLLCTILQVYQFSISAAILLLPYFVWISYSAYLTYAILVLNPLTFGITV